MGASYRECRISASWANIWRRPNVPTSTTSRISAHIPKPTKMIRPCPLYVCIPRNLIVYLDYLLRQRCHIVDSMYYLCNLILFFFTLLEQNNMVPAAPITQPTVEHRTETRSIFLSPAARVPRALAEGEGAGSCPRSLVNSTMA